MIASWQKAVTNLDNVLKSRDITLLTKFHTVKIMVFPMVTCDCESRILKKAECQRIDAFELWCWRWLLRVPWTARRSNQSILKEIYPGYSLEGLMLKLNLQYFGHLMWIANSLEKSLMLGKIEGSRKLPSSSRISEDEMAGWLDGITDAMDKNPGKLQEVARDREAWRVAIHGVTKSQTRLDTWTTTIFLLKKGSQLRAQKGGGEIIFSPLHTPDRIMAGPWGEECQKGNKVPRSFSMTSYLPSGLHHFWVLEEQFELEGRPLICKRKYEGKGRLWEP